jgi:hypothetical protein
LKLTAELFHSTLRSLKGDAVDRRRHPRAPMRAKLKIIPLQEPRWTAPIELWTRDIAQGGICVVCPFDFPQGMRFLVQLPRSHGTPLILLCTVRNSAPLSGGFYTAGASYVEVAASTSSAEEGKKVAPIVSKEQAEIERISRSILGGNEPPA